MKERKKKKEREKTPFIVDTQFRDSARKPLGPINVINFTVMYEQISFKKGYFWLIIDWYSGNVADY